MATIQQAKELLHTYETTQVEWNPSFAPTQPSLLELMDHYWMSKYRDGDGTGSGWMKLFYNILENPTLVAAKMIDLDTKDVKIMAEPGYDHYQAYFFQRELDIYMKEKNFGKLLNQSVFNLPKYGHIVLKKVRGELQMVPIGNVIIDPTAKGLKENPHMEKHRFTPSELEIQGERLGWDNVDGVLDKEPDKDGRFTIYEMLDPTDRSYLILFLDPSGEGGIILKETKMDDMYREHKWEDVPGRYLGRGQVEKLLMNQIGKNENKDMFRQGLRWTSLHAFQTRDVSIARNLLTEVENGEIFNTASEIMPIAFEERNLGAYQYEDQSWDMNTDDRTFAFDPVQGQRSPAGTPLGSSILQARMAGSFFEQRQEELGMFWQEVIRKDIIPDFKKNRRPKHLIDLLNLGDDTEGEKLRQNLLGHRFNERIINQFLKNKRMPSMEERQLIRTALTESMKKSKKMDMQVPDDWYENLKYKIKVVITGEQIDVAAKMNLAITFLQIIGSNPAILQEKRTRKAIQKVMEWGGINPEEFNLDEEETQSIPQLAQRGGSTPRQAAPSVQPAILNQTSTV